MSHKYIYDSRCRSYHTVGSRRFILRILHNWQYGDYPQNLRRTLLWAVGDQGVICRAKSNQKYDLSNLSMTNDLTQQTAIIYWCDSWRLFHHHLKQIDDYNQGTCLEVIHHRNPHKLSQNSFRKTTAIPTP